jgi:hypothetical protein
MSYISSSEALRSSRYYLKTTISYSEQRIHLNYTDQPVTVYLGRESLFTALVTLTIRIILHVILKTDDFCVISYGGQRACCKDMDQ